MYGSYDENSFEARKNEGPQARMFREQDEQEQKDRKKIETFLASLTPEDAQLDLFTFAEIKQWDLKHCRRRAKDVEDD